MLGLVLFLAEEYYHHLTVPNTVKSKHFGTIKFR